jgi:NADH:ubiquinone oxidoreductase subunit F (NADH-binding)
MKAVIVGGLSVPVMKADEIANLKMDYDGCLNAGTMLGSGGIMVMNESVSIPEIALRTIKFYAHESCGQCTPCREGSITIRRLLERIINGLGRSQDINTILNICKNVKGLTLCPTGDAFAMPIEAMITKFRDEFEALVG